MREQGKKGISTIIKEFQLSLDKREKLIKARIDKAQKTFDRWVKKEGSAVDDVCCLIDESKDDFLSIIQKKKGIHDAYHAKKNAKRAKLFEDVAEEERKIRDVRDMLAAVSSPLETISLVLEEITPVLKTLIESTRGDLAGTLATIIGDGFLATFNECVEKISADHKNKTSKLWAEALGGHRDALTEAGFTREEAVHLLGTLRGPLQQYAETLIKVTRK